MKLSLETPDGLQGAGWFSDLHFWRIIHTSRTSVHVDFVCGCSAITEAETLEFFTTVRPPHCAGAPVTNLCDAHGSLCFQALYG